MRVSMKLTPGKPLAIGIALTAVMVNAQPATNRPGTINSIPAAPVNRSSSNLMASSIERFSTDLAALERYYDISISKTRWDRLRRFYEDEYRTLEALDFDALDPDGRIDYLLLRGKLRFELRELDHNQKRRDQVSALIPFFEPIIQLEEARRRSVPIDSERSAETLSTIAGQVAKTRKDLEAQLKDDKKETGSPAPDKVAANRAARMVDDLRKALKHWHDFYAGYDPVFTWWADQPFRKVDKELEDYASFLRKKIVGFKEGEDDPVIGDPIGREALLDGLEAEMIPYTPEELIEIANKEFAWCEAEQRRAAGELGFGDDWHKALDHVSKLHVKPGEQPQLIRTLAEEAIKFVTDHGLVTVPELCNEIWRMEMMTPERQKVTPYFTGGEVISVSYPTATMNYEDKLMSMRGNNIPFSRATVFHEVIPGHHLQVFMAERFHPYRRAFRTPFLVEGWALYWEMLLWDLKFPRSA